LFHFHLVCIEQQFHGKPQVLKRLSHILGVISRIP
jgi:hypothetical protein